MGLNTEIGLLIGWVVLLVLFFIRNNYTYQMKTKAANVIYKYCGYLIANKQYSIGTDYYEEMEIDYFEYFFSFWIFGVAIKPEYKEILKPFIE